MWYKSLRFQSKTCPSAIITKIFILFINRLAKAYDELNIFLTSEKDLNETKEYITAKAIIEEAKPQLPQ